MQPGDVIGIRCDVSPGPFSDEHLVTIETIDGSVSGFVEEGDLRQIDTQWYIRAIVEDVGAEVLRVRVNGSFFTTNGLASVRRSFARAA